MSVSSHEETAHGDMDHGDSDVDKALVVAHEPAPSDHPAESPLHDPAAWENLKSFLAVAATDDFQHELQIGGLVHQLQPIIGGVSKKMLYPWPTLADRNQGLPARLHCRRCRRSSG